MKRQDSTLISPSSHADSLSNDNISSVQAVIRAYERDYFQTFRLLLKKRYIHNCRESYDLFLRNEDRALECFDYLKQRLQYCYSTSARVEDKKDWDYVKRNTILTELAIHMSSSVDFASGFDALLDCSHLQMVSLYIQSVEATANTASVLKTLSFLPSLERLSLSCVSKFDVGFLLSRPSSALCFPHLLSLHIVLPKSCGPLFSFIHVSCPNLTSLSISGPPLEPIKLTNEQISVIASLPLQFLSLTDCGITDEHCAILSESKSFRLLSLFLPQNGSMTPDGLSVLASRFSSLTDLDFSRNSFSPSAARSLHDHLPQLSRLSLRYGDDLDVQCLVTLSNIRSLTSLDISYHHSRLIAAVSFFLARMANLTSLDLSYVVGLGSGGLTCLSKSVSLRSLFLSRCGIGDDELTALARNTTSLTDLRVEEKDNSIHDEAIIALFDTSSRVHLHRFYCASYKLSDRSAVVFAQSPCLTDLEIHPGNAFTAQGLVSLSRIPNLLRLFVHRVNFSIFSDQVASQFARHPHLETTNLPSGSSSTSHRVESVLLEFALRMLFNKYCRQCWQRICCLIAFERANIDNALRHSFLPLVETRFWRDPSNPFAAMLS